MTTLLIEIYETEQDETETFLYGFYKAKDKNHFSKNLTRKTFNLHSQFFSNK